jgi:hypothetical protein
VFRGFPVFLSRCFFSGLKYCIEEGKRKLDFDAFTEVKKIAVKRIEN